MKIGVEQAVLLHAYLDDISRHLINIQHRLHYFDLKKPDFKGLGLSSYFPLEDLVVLKRTVGSGLVGVKKGLLLGLCRFLCFGPSGCLLRFCSFLCSLGFPSCFGLLGCLCLGLLGFLRFGSPGFLG